MDILEKYADNIFRNTEGYFVLIFGDEVLLFAHKCDLVFHLNNYGLRSL